jgi:cystathionine beta-lyase/cystathionine gamma-synthase
MDEVKQARLETLAIHAGQMPDPTTGAVMTPVYLTSTYAQDDVGAHRGYEYSRTSNPTRYALEQCLAALEDGPYALAFASGMAATDAVIRLLRPGDHVVAGNDVYGGTYRLFQRIWADFGLRFSFVDTADPDVVARALEPATRLVWLETPTNPLLRLADIAAISTLAHEREALVVVDNTFATPYAQRPLTLGADIVVHSTTKYLGGHSDVVGGAVMLRDRGLYERLTYLENATGGVPGPLDCFLVLRGIKTLPVRMRAHSENAFAVAQYLEAHAKVARVHYPGLPSHPQYELARRQMSIPGGMVSFEVKGSANGSAKGAAANARHVVAGTRLFTLAESLGGVESLIEVPAAMTHLSVADSPLAVPSNLVRLSVGLEHVADLLADLEQALAAA